MVDGVGAFIRVTAGNSSGMKTNPYSRRVPRWSVGIAVGALAAVSVSACSSGGSSSSALTAMQQVRQQNRESVVGAFVSAANQTTHGFSVIVARVTYPKNSVENTSANEGVADDCSARQRKAW